MRKFIFITDEGSTQDPDYNDYDNLQVIGVAGGLDEKEALDNLLIEYSWIKESAFDVGKFKCLELKV